MNETLTLTLAWLAGGFIGVVFFGGLWWTIRRALSSPQPALWFFGSLLLRMGTAVVGFYLASRGDWQRLVACLLGFIMARFAVTWMTRSTKDNETRPAQEVTHAT